MRKTPDMIDLWLYTVVHTDRHTDTNTETHTHRVSWDKPHRMGEGVYKHASNKLSIWPKPGGDSL